jgi:hypothetical protein
MPNIAFITDAKSADSSIFQVVVAAALENGASVEQVDRLSAKDSAPGKVWVVLSHADVVVAYVSKGASNLFYEIGLAHGLRKPVILVMDRQIKLPPDLKGQHFLFSVSEPPISDVLQFQLSELMKRLLRTHDHSLDVWGPRNFNRLSTKSERPVVPEWSDILNEAPSLRGRAFEGWLRTLLNSVDHFSVEEAPQGLVHNELGYDFAIWNSIKDPDLAVLGNPIPVVAKAYQTIVSIPSLLNELTEVAQRQELRSVILATTAYTSPSVRNKLEQVLNERNILIVVLDRSNLQAIRSPQSLISAIKSRIFEIMYAGGTDGV